MNTSISKRRVFLASKKNSGHRLTIGFAGIADFRSFIGQEYIAGIVKATIDYDINLINFAGAVKYSLFDDIDFIPHYLKNFNFMKEPLIDGLVTWASSMCTYMENEEIISQFENLKPLPMVDIGYLRIPEVPSIKIDNESSIETIFNHLINEHSYSKFAFIGSNISSPHKHRLEAYKNELKKHNIQEVPNSIYMSKSMNISDISLIVEELLKKHDLKEKKEIECIVTSSDIIASIIIDELDKHGIIVPIDVAVTGFNNQYNGISASCPVTTMDLEYFKRGYVAVELLIDRIMNPKMNYESQTVQTSLLIRQSCGCFEESIVESGINPFKMVKEQFHSSISEEELRSFLFNQVRNIFLRHDLSEIDALVDSIFYDIYEQPNPSKMLRWFQKNLRKTAQKSTSNNSEIQKCITMLRNTVIPMVRDDESQLLHIETVFHQIRALVSVYVEYDNISSKENSYLMNNLSQIAITFASATSGKQIKDALKLHLSELDISGIILALNESISSNLIESNVELVIPTPQIDIQEKLPLKVHEPVLIPKFFFPQNRRFSFMLEVLYHKDKYFGYAFLEIGNNNIAVYDAVRTLLSNALNSVYKKEGRTKENSITLKKEQIEGILSIENDEKNSNRLNSTQITNYLLEHLNEMTNLDKMSEDLFVSKSHLVRRAKELTGYTIQTLHEMLKIEQAKNLLQSPSMKLAEIAERLGFQTQNYFSSVFKKNTGMSPRLWAQRYLKK